ncbi:DNA-binding transcriptional activator of the SARP family [Micromonospora pallida]|uniref:DNA-binding transcriptional activator of the SARP family n=1 Tax=Micromonospora pallida TaxID=145854 RepID=A0A1C6RTH3_9ACTN|nr:BTAD domain-containing putative transcriptional regulator [Micromonospora pallida]SCL20358.1 DNA-binding transcriptional activator of the SARP family [Micromonospora pallida]
MRWPRQVASVMVVVLLVVLPPVLLVRLAGWPLPSRPSLAQLQRWVAEPITAQTVTAALTIGGWLLWLLVVAAVVLRVLARVKAVARWMRRVPLPTPLQATATGLAGVAVFGTNAATAAPVADQPTATAPAAGDSREPLDERAPDRQAGVAGVVVPGGWMPRETAEQIAAAGALLWLRRRRFYRPAAPGPQPRDPDLAPLPAVVAVAQTAVTTDTDQQGDHTGQDTPAVGRQDGDEPIVVFPPGGVGLTGPGASDAARGILVTSALQALRDLASAMRLVTTRVDIDALLGPHPPVSAVAGIHVVPTLDDALAVVASQTPPVPPHPGEGQKTSRGRLLLLTHAPVNGSLVAATADSDVALIVVGEYPAGEAWSVDPSGRIRSPHSPDVRRRMCVLDRAAVRDILTVISPPEAITIGGSLTQPSPPPLLPHPRSPARNPNHQTGSDARRSDPSTVRLRVLGGVSVSFQDTAVTIRRSAALQALVFLAVHPDGVTGRDLVEAIWPGLPAHRVTGRLYTTMSDLRKAIRDTCGMALIEHADDRYRLSPDLDVDLWRLHHAVQQATTALTDRPQAWQAVIDQFDGALADGYAWPWLDAHREVVRRHVIDAHVALADAQPDRRQALALLQDAIRVDPYNEHLHQRAAQILAALGDQVAASDLLDAYGKRLAHAGLTATDLPPEAGRAVR